MSQGSPGRTVLSRTVSRDRIISKYPSAFHPDATPYHQINFDPSVKQACAQDRTGTVGLKICKAVLVGDIAVGKSCLVNRFCHDVFDREYKATIGVDFEVEKFSVLSVPFNLQIWDTAGQERFKCIAASYYRGANLVIVVFDLNDIESLGKCRKWKIDACETANDPIVFLVGAKKDLVSHEHYQDVEREAVRLADELDAEYWALSSKTGEHVKEFFFRAAALVFDRAVQKELEHVKNPTKQIGDSLVRVNTHDLYEKRKSKMKCCR